MSVPTNIEGTDNDLEHFYRPFRNHIAPARSCCRDHLRTFAGRSLHLGNGRGGGDTAAIHAEIPSPDLHYDYVSHCAPLSGMGPGIRSADCASARVADIFDLDDVTAELPRAVAN